MTLGTTFMGSRMERCTFGMETNNIRVRIKSPWYLFSGIANSHIFFDPEKKTWVLESLRQPEKKIHMVTNKPGELPFGTHNW